jgi:hypothetical protein
MRIYGSMATKAKTTIARERRRRFVILFYRLTPHLRYSATSTPYPLNYTATPKPRATFTIDAVS